MRSNRSSLIGSLVITDVRTLGPPVVVFVAALNILQSEVVAAALGLASLSFTFAAACRIRVEIDGSQVVICNGGRVRRVDLHAGYQMATYHWNSKWMQVPSVRVDDGKVRILGYWGLSNEEQADLLRALGRRPTERRR